MGLRGTQVLLEGQAQTVDPVRMDTKGLKENQASDMDMDLLDHVDRRYLMTDWKCWMNNRNDT